MIAAKDISRWQGSYTETGEPIAFVKISGGDQGLYIDPQAANNYNQVIAHGHAFAGYHFAGGTDPITEANFYLNAMKPWNPGEVPCLDWEISNPDPVGWCLRFATHVHDVAGAWPIIYMNRSTLMSFNWQPVLANCALWLADWVGTPDPNIDTGSYTYTVLQYNDGPNYDHDVVYVESIDQFKKFGWPEPQAPAPTPPPPQPVETPQPTPVPEIQPTPEPAPPVTNPQTAPVTPDAPTPPISPAPVETSPTPPAEPEPVVKPKQSLLERLLSWILRFVKDK